MAFATFDEMNRTMEQMRTMRGREGWNDATSLEERDGEYRFVIDLPGFEREEISLTFDDGVPARRSRAGARRASLGGVLAVTAGREAKSETLARRRHVDKRVTVPGHIDTEAITATYRNGVFEVRLPTMDEDADVDGRSIEIAD